MARNHSKQQVPPNVDQSPLAYIRAAVALARGVDHTGDEYEDAQKSLQRMFADLIERGEHTADLCVRFRIRAGRRAGVSLVHRRESIRDDMLYNVIASLMRAGTDRLQVCRAPIAGGDKECGKLFVKVTRKRFCSQRCQIRAFMRTWPGPKKGKGARHGKATRTRGR